MKIKIPKTLLEPLTIGWPEPYGHGQIYQWIKDELRLCFRGFGFAQMLPTEDDDDAMSTKDLCDALHVLAEMRGGENVSARCVNLIRGAKRVGYMFVVGFSEPGKSKVHEVWLKTYF